MDWKIYTCDCLNNYLTTLELEALDDFLNKNIIKKNNTMSPGHFRCRPAVVHLYFLSTKDQKTSEYHQEIPKSHTADQDQT